MSHHDHALELLLTGKTAIETARLVGVDVRTVRRWKKDPAFAEELSDLRQEIHDEIILRAMALVEKIQTAAFEQLAWLQAMANKLRTLSDKLRCMNAISQLNFKWSKFIMDRQDRKSIAQFARTAQPAKKADANGQGLGATEQTAVSFAPCCEAPKPEQPQPAPKADINGHHPSASANSSATINAPQLGGTEDTALGSSLAPTTAQKAGVNGHASGATEQTAVSFAPCCEDPKPQQPQPAPKADMNGHRPSASANTLATIKAPQQGGTEDTALGSSLAPRPSPKADANGHSTPMDPELQELKAHRAKLAASKPTQKADINGH